MIGKKKKANSTYLFQREAEIRQKYELKINAEEQTKNQFIFQIEKKRPKRDNSLWMFVGFLAVIVGWIVIHSFFCGVVMGVVVYGFGILVGVGLEKSKNKVVDDEIDERKRKCSDNIRKLENERDRQIEAMRSEYDEKTSENMKKYLQSRQTVEIENWIAKRFFAQINGADRRPHIKEINAKYTYTVHKDKIVGDDGTFDFTIECYQHLRNIYEQIGLARALFKKVEWITGNTFKVDVNGLKPTISRESDDYTITIKYSVPNGKYVFPKSFDKV